MMWLENVILTDEIKYNLIVITILKYYYKCINNFNFNIARILLIG